MNEDEDYRIFTDEARRIIDQLVQHTLAHVNDLDEQENVEIPSRFIQSENDGKPEEYSSIQWPTIAEFTNEKLGLDKIHEYIEKVILTWNTFFLPRISSGDNQSNDMNFQGMENIFR